MYYAGYAALPDYARWDHLHPLHPLSGPLHRVSMGNQEQIIVKIYCCGFFGIGNVQSNQFPPPPSTFCTVWKFVWIFYSLNVSIGGKQHTSLVSNEMVEFWNGSLSDQSLVNRILCLVYHPCNRCAKPEFHVVRNSGVSQILIQSALIRAKAASSLTKS